jgi:hypothetical protein
MPEIPTKTRWIALVCIAIAGVGYWYLNRSYEGLSPRGYKLAVALYSACNQKNSEKLEKISNLIQDSLRTGDLPDRDSRWLRKVIQLGQAKDWDTASSLVRRIMMDQNSDAP